MNRIANVGFQETAPCASASANGLKRGISPMVVVPAKVGFHPLRTFKAGLGGGWTCSSAAIRQGDLQLVEAGGLPTFVNLVTNGYVAPIPAIATNAGL
jgi:hypothetical protein